MDSKEEIYVGIDIGSSKIATVVGKREGEDFLSIIGVGITRSEGIKKGVISDIEEAVSCLGDSIEIAERMAACNIEFASVNINGSSIVSQNSNGVVGVGRADKKIGQEDILRAEAAAQAIQVKPNQDILHVIPRVYKVDDQEGIRNPLGMTGIRLEVETHVVTVAIQARDSLERVLKQAGIKIIDEIATPLASAKAVAKKRQMDLGCAVVDIGAATTGIAVFEDGEILHTVVLPVGGMHITNDLAIGLRTSIDVAEKVKIKYGHAYHKAVSENQKIDLSVIDVREEAEFSARHISEIIEARLEEIFLMTLEELRKIGREKLLPAGVILTGGTAKIPGLEDKAKEILKLPVELGQPHNLMGLTEKVYDPTMSAAIGLLLYNFEESKGQISVSNWTKTLDYFKKVLKSFLP